MLASNIISATLSGQVFKKGWPSILRKPETGHQCYCWAYRYIHTAVRKH